MDHTIQVMIFLLSTTNRVDIHKETILKEVSLKEASLREASLKEASLKEASLKEASLKEASLKEAFLREDFLKEASLREDFLKEASLKEASLKEASLKEASLKEASLKADTLNKAMDFLKEQVIPEVHIKEKMHILCLEAYHKGYTNQVIKYLQRSIKLQQLNQVQSLNLNLIPWHQTSHRTKLLIRM